MSSSTSLPTSQQDDEAYSFALYLRSAYVFSHALAICLQLKLFDIIAQAGPLTAAEITAHLPTRNPDAPSMIDRLLRLLASYSLLTSSHGLIERRYGLSSTGQFFVRDNKHGVSMAAFPADAKALTEAWCVVFFYCILCLGDSITFCMNFKPQIKVGFRPTHKSFHASIHLLIRIFKFS